jgi:hypothetical protein
MAAFAEFAAQRARYSAFSSILCRKLGIYREKVAFFVFEIHILAVAVTK